MRKYLREAAGRGVVLCAALLLMTGCAVRTETRTIPPATVVTTETAEIDASDEGILSGTLDVVGDVIALPFRAVAGVFRLIF